MTITYLRTPYFQTKISSRTGGCIHHPQTNYRAYNLFVLKTRLEPLAKKRLGFPLFIHFDNRYLDERMIVTVEFWKKGEPLELSIPDKIFLQHALEHIISDGPDLCLLMSDDSQWLTNTSGSLTELTDSQKQVIPSWWTTEVAQFLSFTPHVRAHHRPAEEYQMPGIYIDLSKFDTFKSFFSSMYNDAIYRLTEMYQLGYLSLPISFDSDRLKKWNLVQMLDATIENKLNLRRILFHPGWEDSRLTDPVGGMIGFLVKHVVNGSNKVLLNAGRGSIIRHRVAFTLQRLFTSQKYRFIEDMVEVEVDNLFVAQRAASLIQLSETVVITKLITFQYPTKDWFNLYLMLLLKMTNDEKLKYGLTGLEVLGYLIAEPNANYCLSCQIPYHVQNEYYESMIYRYLKDHITDIPELLAQTKRISEKMPVPEKILPRLDIRAKKAREVRKARKVLPDPDLISLKDSILDPLIDLEMDKIPKRKVRLRVRPSGTSLGLDQKIEELGFIDDRFLGSIGMKQKQPFSTTKFPEDVTTRILGSPPRLIT